MDDLVAEARLDAKAFRENTVYDSDGQAIRLGANADRLDRYADRIEALQAEVARLQGHVAKDATRFSACAVMLAGSFNISGTLRAERVMKMEHFALEARQALKGTDNAE